MIPLPERLRPKTLGDIVGQDHLLGPDGVLSAFLASGHLPSLLVWGPPGTGKTTLARLLAERFNIHFAPFSAVLSGVKELREVLSEAENRRAAFEQRTLLFVDEIHRFNKGQQDALLPAVERGQVILVGATTENPSFSVNPALQSRCRVFALKPLDSDALMALIQRAISHPDGLKAQIEPEAEEALCRLSGGDGRRLLLLLEECAALAGSESINARIVLQVASGARPGHDKAGEAHYDVASAFIKSMRASDVQAALFYLARQVEAGEDPRFIARRLVIFASEDVGLADPQALVQAVAAFQAVSSIGLPEAVYPLTQAVIYCATAPKSNSAKSYFAAAQACKEHPGAQVPLFLRNAPTRLMSDLGYGAGYVYDHDAPHHFAGQDCLPDEILGAQFYTPGDFGHEKEIQKRMEWWQFRRIRRKVKP